MPGRQRVVVGAVIGLALAVLIGIAAALAGPRRPSSPDASVHAGDEQPGPPPATEQHPAPPEPAADDGDGEPRRRWYGTAILALIAAALTGLAVSGYVWLNHWHSPVTLTASANSSTRTVSIVQDLRLTAAANGSEVRWGVDSGSARRLIVSGEDTEVIVPLSSSLCQAAANTLHATCANGNQLLTGSPTTFK